LLEEFNSNLEMNSDKWVEKAEEAAKHLQDVEGSYRSLISPPDLTHTLSLSVSLNRNSVAVLERKVRMLMQQIDSSTEAAHEEEKGDL
jgi:hypothetical protein